MMWAKGTLGEDEIAERKKAIAEERAAYVTDAWYNQQQEGTSKDDAENRITDFPAVRDMLGVCKFTGKQVDALHEAQREMNALMKRGNATQQEIDSVLATACYALMDRTTSLEMSLYMRLPDGKGGWAIQWDKPQTEVGAYTDAIDDLFGRAERWAKHYNYAKTASKILIRDPNEHLIATVGIAETLLADFVLKVRPHGPWDVKDSSSWDDNVRRGHPEVKEQGSSSYRFVYRGELLNAQELGNYLYGYAGAAIGFPNEIIYLGGGVVQNLEDHKANFQEWSLLPSKLYGDTPEDRLFIEKGIERFKEDAS